MNACTFTDEGGAAIATRKDVADRANVSEATVSRVLNGLAPVREETRQRVLAAAGELRYVPSSIARNFARSRSGNIGVSLPLIPRVRNLFSTYYFSEILSGIAEYAGGSGFDVLLLFRAAGETEAWLSYFHAKRIDGCVILGASDLPEERLALRALHEEGYPYCLVNQRFEGEAFHFVDGDHVDGSYQAVRYLLDKGHRRIAFLNGPAQYSNSRDRFAGYEQAMREYGAAVDRELLLSGNYSRTSGVLAARELAARIGKTDAVFAANDRMAIGLLQGLAEQGIRAGGGLDIVGYDDSDAARMAEPPLTTVSVPFHEMGRQAARCVHDLLEGREAETSGCRKILPARLIVRGSA